MVRELSTGLHDNMFPAHAPTQSGKFHLSLNLFAIGFHSSTVDRNCRHKAPNSDNMASHTSSTMYEMAVLLTQNWNSRERNASPVDKNLKVRASLSEGDIGDRILVFLAS